MKFLIAGLGSIGRRHLRNLLAQGETDILLYRTHRSTMPDDELADFPVETDLAAALAHKPDAVIISNPTALHLDIAIPAAEAGCHLLLEKPISHSLDRVETLVGTAERRGSKALVGFQFRYHPTLRAIRQKLADGVLGKPLSVRVHWGEYLPDWHPWEDYRQGYAARPDLGGGVILTLCHPLDYVRMLFGEVAQLWCFAGNEGLGLPVEDAAEIGLRFQNGMLGSVHVNYNQRPPKHDMEIVGTEGTIYWDNADGEAHIFRAADSTLETLSPPAGFERNHLFMDETRNFLAMLRGEEAADCTLDDGVQALRLALAAQDAAKSGKMVAF